MTYPVTFDLALDWSQMALMVSWVFQKDTAGIGYFGFLLRVAKKENTSIIKKYFYQKAFKNDTT